MLPPTYSRQWCWRHRHERRWVHQVSSDPQTSSRITQQIFRNSPADGAESLLRGTPPSSLQVGGLRQRVAGGRYLTGRKTDGDARMSKGVPDMFDRVEIAESGWSENVQYVSDHDSGIEACEKSLVLKEGGVMVASSGNASRHHLRE